MRLHDLKPRPGAKHRRKRLGQGESSGHGKTSGRGGKGQTARSGSSIRIGFEGGQMPLIRRIPKRGFNNARHTTAYVPVNLEALNQFDDGAQIDVEAIRKAGLANGPVKLVKILGDGELKKKLTVVGAQVQRVGQTEDRSRRRHLRSHRRKSRQPRRKHVTMFQKIASTFANCFKIPELKSRIIYTLIILAVCRCSFDHPDPRH